MIGEALQKTCTRCKRTLPLSEYTRAKGGKYGLKARCRDCSNRASAEYAAANYERLRAVQRQYQRDHKERAAALSAQRRRENPEVFKARKDRWRAKNPGYNQKFWRANRDRLLAERAGVPDPKAKDRQKKYRISKANDPRHKVSHTFRNAMYRAIRASLKGGSSTFELVGYTVDQLMEHIERQFLPGMSWGNYGANGWHIDHVLPLSSFEFSSPQDDEFRAAWALTNLRPLWASENHSKGARRLLLV